MFFKRFYDDNLAQASYMIACEKTREAIIVDPNLDVAQAKGIADVSNLAGGYESWVAEGFEVER